MDTNLIFYCAIAVGVIALVFAYIKYLSITKIEPGNERMKEISGYIQDKLGKVADVFDQIKEDNFVMKVLDTDNKRVDISI